MYFVATIREKQSREQDFYMCPTVFFKDVQVFRNKVDSMLNEYWEVVEDAPILVSSLRPGPHSLLGGIT